MEIGNMEKLVIFALPLPGIESGISGMAIPGKPVCKLLNEGDRQITSCIRLCGLNDKLL